MEKVDVAVIGGGILGTCISYWLSLLYEGKIAVLEAENDVAVHTSGRNTGVIHRPFYLDPVKRKTFARSAQISYGLWKEYAKLKNLPWSETGTIEVATDEHQLKHLEKYVAWSRQNRMEPDEVLLLNPEEVRKNEPNVNCLGAIFCKTDVSVDYRSFTQYLKDDAVANGVDFLLGFDVKDVRRGREYLEVVAKKSLFPIRTKYLINCAGGNAIDIVHLFQIGMEYTDLHFRGEYWEISKEKSGLVNTNIYTVPKHPDIPFLDPHWIVRADGRREIGPNAVLVSGSKTYNGFFSSIGELAVKVFESPIKNKLSLFTNKDFLKLASEEWYSSISKSAMAKRVKRFIPKLEVADLVRRGTAGIRSSVIDSKGNFMKEAIEISGHLSHHILNYNSPGATGAPAYTAYLVDQLSKKGHLAHLKRRSTPSESFWNYKEIIEQFGS